MADWESAPSSAGWESAPKDSAFSKFVQGPGKTLLMFGPMGVSLAAAGHGMEVMDKAAYKAGEAVSDFASQHGSISPEVAAGSGVATNLVVQAAPTFLGGEVAKLGAPILRKMAEKTMQSAIKPPSELMHKGFGRTASEGERAIQTALDEGIYATDMGGAKARSLIDKVEADKAALIATKPLAEIEKADVAKRLLDVRDRFTNQPRPEEDLKKIGDAYTEFINSPYVLPKVPLQQAHDIKTGGGGIIRKKYGELSPVDAEIDKALVRGFKEEIEKVLPEMKTLNAREQNLINTMLLVDRRAAMSGNNNLGGLSYLTHSPEAMAAFMADRSSAFKSVMAHLIDANKRTAPQAVGNIAGGAAGAYTGRREQ